MCQASFCSFGGFGANLSSKRPGFIGKFQEALLLAPFLTLNLGQEPHVLLTLMNLYNMLDISAMKKEDKDLHIESKKPLIKGLLLC